MPPPGRTLWLVEDLRRAAAGRSLLRRRSRQRALSGRRRTRRSGSPSMSRHRPSRWADRSARVRASRHSSGPSSDRKVEQSTSMRTRHARPSTSDRYDVRDAEPDRASASRGEVGDNGPCGSGRRSPSARATTFPTLPLAPRIRSVCALSVISARCVTPRPTIVVSKRLDEHALGDTSGSAQMLNSAAGVGSLRRSHHPSPRGRSGRASGCSEHSSPTFVSGPVATRVSSRPAAAKLLGDEVDSVLLTRLRARGGQVGSVETRFAVHMGRDVACANERLVGARVNGDVGAGPASSSTFSALTVVLSSVWLPETVVTATSPAPARPAQKRDRDRRRAPDRSRE